MKLFKCLSHNSSIVQEQKAKRSHKLKISFKKRKPLKTNGEEDVPCKSRGISVQDENINPCASSEPVIEYSSLVIVDSPINESNKIRPIVKNASCPMDTLLPFADNAIQGRTDNVNLLSISNNPINVDDSLYKTLTVNIDDGLHKAFTVNADDGLHKTFTVNAPSSNFKLSLNKLVLSPSKKFHNNSRKMPGVTLETIYETNSQVDKSRKTKTNQKLFLEERRTDGDGCADESTTHATGVFKPSSKPRSKRSKYIGDDQIQQTIHRLLSLEEEYVNFMLSGIEKFCRPLRRYVFSSHQHTTVFQNIEKLVTISKNNIKQMEDSNSSIDVDNNKDPHLLALVYESKINVMCQAYEAYARGYERSQTTLREMRKHKTFVKFMTGAENEVPGYLTINAFIDRPNLHIQDVNKILDEVLALTPQHSPGFGSLHTVTQQLSQCVDTVIDLCPTKEMQDATSGQNNLNRSTTLIDKPINASQINIKLSESSRSENIIHIQDNIDFVPSLCNKVCSSPQKNCYREVVEETASIV